MEFSDITSKLKPIVRTVAPTIATMLGGPLAGTAVAAISEAVLGKKEGTESEIYAALSSASPEILLKLKEAENNMKVRLKELGVKEKELENQDRDSARQREAAVRDKMPAVLAVLAALGFFATMVGLFTFEVPKVNEPLVFSMVGVLGTLTVSAFAYYHGSSSGSTAKNGIIERMKDGK